MEIDLSIILSNLLLFFVIFCVVPLILMVIALYFVVRRITTYAAPDISKIQQDYAKLRAANPKASQEKLVRKIINQQAMRCGVVGALTSLGGFYTLPIGLPADVLISMRIQATMVAFIAAAYGQTEATEREMKLRTYLVTTGGIRFTETTSRLAMRFILRIMGKSFAKLIPFIGAIVGYVINYSIAQASGNMALRWYASKAVVQQQPPS